MNWRDQPPEQQTPEWVKSWAVARFAHHDMRLFPEQEPGYRETDSDWNQALEQHGLMPPKDRARYVEEAAKLPSVDIAALMAGQVDVRKPIPALADDDPIPF